jgi:hypothetical protein
VIWAGLALVAAGWTWGCVSLGSEWFNEGVYFPTAFLLNSLLKLWVAAEAGRQFAEDRQSGALELVLSTSLSVKDILRGQRLAVRRRILGPLLVVLAVEGIFLAASLQRESFHDQPINPVLWFAGMAMLLADLLALTWTGMWDAMTAKKPNHVTGKTIVRILIAPWVLFFPVAIVVGLFLEDSFRSSGPPWLFFVSVWFGVGLATDLAYTVGVATHLQRSFRTLALQRFAPASALWARLRRKRGAKLTG